MECYSREAYLVDHTNIPKLLDKAEEQPYQPGIGVKDPSLDYR